ncbi:hypothetical protein GCM10027578_30710 [Spirosoma luteolum]
MRAATQRLSLFLSFALSPFITFAQPYEAAMIRQGLVDVQQADPSIQVALAYSTTQNFVGRDVYGELTRAYLQPMAALKLATASRYLQQRHPNLRLLVYDAARPQRAQQALWDALPQMPPRQRRQYVADPREGSIHSYGCAVDLTVATADGQPLDMGTPFDYFGELAYPKREAQLVQTGRLTRAQLANRLILREAMERAGFMRIEYEWWHFNALSRARAKATYSPVR